MTHSQRHRSGKHRPGQHRALAFAALALAVLAVGCGSDGATEDASAVIVVEGVDATVDAGATAEGSEEDQALAFAGCMRGEGVDFPDPVVNADGSVEFFGANTDRDTDGFAQTPGFQDAVDNCGSLIDGASFLPDDDDFTELEDQFLEAAECLRENGVDVPDPEFGEGGPGGGGPFGADFNPDDPETAAAIDACQDIFAGFDAQQVGGN